MTDRPTDSSIWRILAICTGHIGGVLLITPALELLRQNFPVAEISVLVRRGTEAMLQNNPSVHQIYVDGEITSNQQMCKRTRTSLRQRLGQIPAGLKLVPTLRREKFDLALDFSGSDRGAILAFLSGAKKRVSYHPKGGFPGKARLFTQLCPRSPQRIHKVLQNAELVFHIVSGVSLSVESRREVGSLVFNPLPEDLSRAEAEWQKMAMGKRHRILIHPTSRVLYKCWAAEKWAHVIGRVQSNLDAGVLLTCSPDAKEIEMTRRIIDLCPVKPGARLGGLNFSQLGALIKHADLFLGVDSAPMHLAAAVKTPVVAIFGPSHDALWSPWGAGHRVVRRPCPCLNLDRPRCSPEQGMDCLKAVSADELYEALLDVLRESESAGRL